MPGHDLCSAGRRLGLWGLVGVLAGSGAAAEPALECQTVTYVGRRDDAVVGVAIQADGTLVVAANVAAGPFVAGHVRELGKGPGVVLRLAPDGKKILSVTRVAQRLRDLALDQADRIFLAADDDGAICLDAGAERVSGKQAVGGRCARIAAAPDGHCAALRYGKEDDTATGAGQVTVFDPQGKQVGQFAGHRNTLDLCVDDRSRTVVLIGWRQANAFDLLKTQPVQIAYVRGYSYSGEVKYTLYDWPTEQDAPGFINRLTNNMADTRGYRCAIGRDGRLYCAFECAGGNHIFRFEPQLEKDQWVRAGGKKPKGDDYHGFHNSRAEHKTFFGRYDPGTGAYLAGQEFCARLNNGRANAVRVVDGAITAAETGTVALAGSSAYGLPLAFLPPGTGDYTGGSFLLLMHPELKQRLYCTRFQAGAVSRAVDARTVKGQLIVVVGGTNNDKSPGEFWVKDALQPAGDTGCGFLAVFVGK